MDGSSNSGGDGNEGVGFPTIVVQRGDQWILFSVFV